MMFSLDDWLQGLWKSRGISFCSRNFLRPQQQILMFIDVTLSRLIREMNVVLIVFPNKGSSKHQAE